MLVSFCRTSVLRFCLALVLSWLLLVPVASAGTLSDRMAAFPDWTNKPPVRVVEGDLSYPDWMAGNWRVTTTLVEQFAPLAPEVVTPGFGSNEQFLNQPIEFRVRFVPETAIAGKKFQLPDTLLPLKSLVGIDVVADRAFNGLNLARAYLGDRAVLSVTVDPYSPNRQLTLLQGNRQLLSVVTGRTVETPDADHFLTTELFQQVFRGTTQPYLNQVETTTAYQRLETSNPAIVADQMTAIYLSPQDPEYFKAGEHPVALYHYRMAFVREE